MTDALTDEQWAIWEEAQLAEKGHWIALWGPDGSPNREWLMRHEYIKAEFLFDQLLAQFDIHPEVDWANDFVLDVGCGPVSVIAERELGKLRFGVDPLRYPNWVYAKYRDHSFRVIRTPFEDWMLDDGETYDRVIFYNALQHFISLEAVAAKLCELLNPKGSALLAEYLRVPTNAAHIQYLERNELDRIFGTNGLKVESYVHPVRLPGYVERPGGLPIDLYLARVTQAS